MEGEVEVGGVVTPLAETGVAPDASLDNDLDGAWFLPLTIGDRAIVHWGGATFAFRFVPPPRRVPNPLLRRLDPHYLNMLLLSLFFHLTLIVTLMVHPGEVQATPPRRFFDAVVELYPDVASTDIRPAPVPRREEPAKNGGRQGPAPADKRKGSRRHATRRANEASVQRRLGRMFGSDSRLLGRGGGTLFGHIANAIGTHGRDGIQVGLRGFGTRGGPALGAFGELRNAGPIETGLPGLGADPGLGDRPERGVVTVERPDVRDPLARDIIHEVVRQNRRQIRFCYERVLYREHELEGKVAVAWVIGGTGEVVDVFIVESTLDNREVERCMIDRIRRWRFPAPAGGGTVRVNYPFVFHAT
jgi:TonB family protein